MPHVRIRFVVTASFAVLAIAAAVGSSLSAQNIASVEINAPSHPGRDGVGPMAGTPVAAEEYDEHGNACQKK